MVECNLAKVEVAGSNPVSRSIYSLDSLGLINFRDTLRGVMLSARVRIGCGFHARKVINELTIGPWGQVPISFHRELNTRVPQLFAHIGNRSTCSKQQTGKRMS